VPQQPDAWLLSVARHRKLDAWRHTRVQDKATQTLMLLAGEVDGGAAEGAAVPDERLRLLFVCAHPAIDRRRARRSCCRPCSASTPRAWPAPS
jgi:RNA polymerase sigma-70 factor (ECF subfamily)